MKTHSTNEHFALNTSKQLVAMTQYIQLHSSAKSVLATIMSCYDVNKQYAYIKQTTIADKCGLSLRQTKTWVRRLIGMGLIHVHKTKVFNTECGRVVFGVNQYVPNVEKWKELLIQSKTSNSYERVSKPSNDKGLPSKTALGNCTTSQLDISNKKNIKTNQDLIDFISLKDFYGNKPNGSWLDYKTGLVFASYKDFLSKSKALGYISGFRRSRLAAELIQTENVAVELIDAGVIAEYVKYKNKKKQEKSAPKPASSAWSLVKTEQFSYEYVDKNNRVFYFESREGLEAHKQAFTRR